jgi:hypothetical protein
LKVGEFALSQNSERERDTCYESRYFVKIWRLNSYFEYPLFKNRTLIIFSKISKVMGFLSIPDNIFVITNDLAVSWIAITFILKLKPDIYDFAVDAL